MIEDFEPLNSVVRSRQFFFCAVLRTSVIFLGMLQQIFKYHLLFYFAGYVKAMVWARVMLSVVLESG